MLCTPDPLHNSAVAKHWYALASSGHVYIHTDEGRIVRPLLHWPLVLPSLEIYNELDVDDLLRMRALRYVDAAEAHARNIHMDATRPVTGGEDDRDLAEVHPILMLGVTAACIPFLQPGSPP